MIKQHLKPYTIFFLVNFICLSAQEGYTYRQDSTIIYFYYDGVKTLSAKNNYEYDYKGRVILRVGFITSGDELRLSSIREYEYTDFSLIETRSRYKSSSNTYEPFKIIIDKNDANGNQTYYAEMGKNAQGELDTSHVVVKEYDESNNLIKRKRP